MSKKKNGSSVDWRAKRVLESLRTTTDPELLLQRYRKLCSFVGDEVANAALDQHTRAAVKAAHDNKYHPKPVVVDKKKGGELVGQRHRQARTA